MILGYASGYKIEFDNLPIQNDLPSEYRLNSHQKSVLQVQIDQLLERGVICEVDLDDDIFVSNIFGRDKPNGDVRMIIDLSEVNEFVSKSRFKMDHLNVALDLLDEEMFLSSIDLKDAYYSVPIWEPHRKYLSFLWKGSMSCHLAYLPLQESSLSCSSQSMQK